MRTHEDMKAMAQRQLDGMTVNRDLLAKDVLTLLERCERLQNIVNGLGKRIEQLEVVANQRAPGAQTGSFAEAFDDLFKDVFKDRKS